MMFLSTLCLAALISSSLPAGETEVSWRGRSTPIEELPAELGEGAPGAAYAWAKWSEANGYRLHLDDSGRVLLITSAEAETVAHQLQLIGKTATLFDEILPPPPLEEKPEDSPAESDAGTPGEIPEDPEGAPAGWAPVGQAELPWTYEWGDDTLPPDSETCVMFVASSERDYHSLLEELARKQEYLRAWLPIGKEYTGFVLERPLAGAYIESAEGMEEWNPDNELVNRVAQMLLIRRFSRQPYWLVQGIAWQLEYRLLNGIYCFPYRQGFVFAVEHTAWPKELRSTFSRRNREPLVIGEFARLKRGEFDPTPARMAFGFAGFLIDHHTEELSPFVEALRLFRAEHDRIDNGDGSWSRSLDYELPFSDQQRLIEGAFGTEVWSETGKFLRKGKSYRPPREN
jgi:hypothetical protein